jgi:hypothetical protein
MKELTEYRRKLIDKLTEAAAELRAACLAVQDPFAPLEDGWNVHQIAVHTRDVNSLVYGLRVRRTAQEDDPEFPNFDGNVYLAENYDAGEPLPRLLDDFVESVEALATFLRTLPGAAWSRVSRHTTLGHGLTLQTWVEKGLAHIEEHLDTVKKQKSP